MPLTSVLQCGDLSASVEENALYKICRRFSGNGQEIQRKYRGNTLAVQCCILLTQYIWQFVNRMNYLVNRISCNASFDSFRKCIAIATKFETN